ncbi:hypothetical protein EVAR_100356_1 [Eumeta japonica]|uniref:Uncharacterized protein n=1 Tax=Eumeta variegata TaxID=151549 RepID=A0A4C2AGA7_EUMVA|nr:hypothetical protein EVAR_100356_1 [Eumeta japonica]
MKRCRRRRARVERLSAVVEYHPRPRASEDKLICWVRIIAVFVTSSSGIKPCAYSGFQLPHVRQHRSVTHCTPRGQNRHKVHRHRNRRFQTDACRYVSKTTSGRVNSQTGPPFVPAAVAPERILTSLCRATLSFPRSLPYPLCTPCCCSEGNDVLPVFGWKQAKSSVFDE